MTPHSSIEGCTSRNRLTKRQVFGHFHLSLATKVSDVTLVLRFALPTQHLAMIA